MLKNYLKIALRNLRRQPGYTFINVAGLTVGLACFLLILLYVQDERRFDRFHEKADHIYRVVETRATPEGGERHLAYTMGPLASTLVRDFPEVTEAVHMLSRNGIGRRTMQYGPNRFYESDYLFTDPEIFDIFDFDLLRGDARTALNEPHTVVLTEAGARKYFGDVDPIGKILGLEQYGDLRVTGLIADPSPQSHLQFSMLISLDTILGLFGLASFTAEQRTKEIGVRKVLGASVGGIVVLLSKDFLQLVAAAFVVAAPVAYVAMDRWLNDFAYRIEISWPIFLMAGLIALLVAVCTVSFQSIRAALANPVESLRYE